MKNKGFVIMFWIYFFFFMADIATTMWNYDKLQYLETNIAYPFIGMTGIIIINLLIIYGLYYLYQKPSVGGRFFVMNIMVILCIARMIALESNIHYITNPVTVVEAQQIGAAAQASGEWVKRQATIAILTYLPLLSGLITYYLWRMDHEVKKK